MEPLRAQSANLAVALTAAAAALTRVAAGTALDHALEQDGATLAGPERAAAQDIAYTACRRLNLLDALLARLMKKPNPHVGGLLRAALSELMDHADSRAHTLVDQAVEAAGSIANGAFKGLVNGVLRAFLREQPALLASLRQDEALRLTHPQWWIDRVRAAWPAQWESILDHGNRAPCMTLRVNVRRTTIEASLARLAAEGVVARRSGPVAITLDRAMPVARLPGFAEGDVSVQDLGAQWAASLLSAALTDATAQGGRLRILDACAAPGGKTAHLLEAIDCDLVALDQDPRRLPSIHANLQRLGLQAECHAVDAADTDAWWDGVPFDAILLDAPCTASGVISRHPDGKWLKRPGDANRLARAQRRLLDALWRALKPGGKLLYATCSLFPDENVRQVEAFLSRHADARRLPLPCGPGTFTGDASPFPLATADGQLLPGPDNDGFYYALLAKT